MLAIFSYTEAELGLRITSSSYDLQIAENRREAKSKGEKERHTYLNAEFQRIARRDKEAFLSDQWKPVQFSSVAQSCPTLCNPIDCSMPGLPVHHHSQSLLKLKSIESVMPSS